jgi:peroxiredoxin
MTLQQQLQSFTSAFAGQMPPEVLRGLQTSIDDLKKSGLADRALKAGDRAPEFALPNARGSQTSLTHLLAGGPIILNFYRGGWCPYCNLELRAYQEILGDIRAAGGDLVAISPQTPDHSLAAAEKNALEFEVLSDHGNRVASLFGIAYPIPEIVKAIGGRFNTDFAAINGSDDGQLPVSATYVIAQDRRIALASVEPDFRMRLEPADALRSLRELAGAAEGEGAAQAVPAKARARRS